MNQAPFFFVRLGGAFVMLEVGPLLALADDQSLPLFVALGRFFVKLSRFRSGAAMAVQAGHANVPAVLVLVDRQFGSDTDFFAGFGALIVEVDLAPRYRFGGEFARLEKTRSPKPFIEAYRFDSGHLVVGLLAFFLPGLITAFEADSFGVTHFIEHFGSERGTSAGLAINQNVRVLFALEVRMAGYFKFQDASGDIDRAGQGACDELTGRSDIQDKIF